MRYRSCLLAMVAAVALWAAPAMAQSIVRPCVDNSPNGCPTVNATNALPNKSGSYISAGAFQTIASFATATSLTVPTGSVGAQICNEGGALRYRDDGTAPTATVGMPISSGSPTAPYCFQYFGPLSAFSAIQQSSGGGPVDVLYYK